MPRFLLMFPTGGFSIEAFIAGAAKPVFVGFHYLVCTTLPAVDLKQSVRLIGL
jgi:hypothetical protein